MRTYKPPEVRGDSRGNLTGNTFIEKGALLFVPSWRQDGEESFFQMQFRVVAEEGLNTFMAFLLIGSQPAWIF